MWKPKKGDVIRFKNLLGTYTYGEVTEVYENTGRIGYSTQKFGFGSYSSGSEHKSQFEFVMREK